MHEEGQTFRTQASDYAGMLPDEAMDADAIAVGLVDRLQGDVGVLGELVGMLEKKLEPIVSQTPEAESPQHTPEMSQVGNILASLEMHTARLSRLFNEIAL